MKDTNLKSDPLFLSCSLLSYVAISMRKESKDLFLSMKKKKPTNGEWSVSLI